MLSSSLNIKLESLSWESDFFSLKTGKLILTENAEIESDFASLNAQLGALNFDEFEIVHCKIPMSKTHWIDALQANAFSLVEGEVDLAYDLSTETQNELTPCLPQGLDEINQLALMAHNQLSACLSCEGDIPILMQAAAKLFQNSRFRPTWYEASASGQFYAKWIEKAVYGSFDDVCLVIRDASDLHDNAEGKILGFVSLKQLSTDEARIGLLGSLSSIHQQPSKRNVGLALIEMAKGWARKQGVKKLFVATQSSNIPALRLYIKTGANILTSSYWFYK